MCTPIMTLTRNVFMSKYSLTVRELCEVDANYCPLFLDESDILYCKWSIHVIYKWIVDDYSVLC